VPAATAQDLVRIGVKLYAENPEAIDLESYIGLFHGWIQRRELPGLPIDVADYQHVPDGPGVMLIGHEADRAIDLDEGRPGALYQRKRDLAGSLRERFRAVLEAAEQTASLIEAEPAANGVRFSRDEFQVRLQDRLAAPNDEATLELLRPDLEAALGDVYPGRSFRIEWIERDPRAPFAARVTLA
jgi:hypothetical protein